MDTYISNPDLAILMDAYHYDKIADKLIQFRSQLSTFGHLDDIKAQWTIDHMTNMIDALLQNIDSMAKADEKGWLR